MAKKVKVKAEWENHETLEDLVLERHHLTENTSAFLKGMQGQVSAEIAIYAREKKISASKLHELNAEDKKNLRDRIGKILSYDNEIHPLHSYVNPEELMKDGFVQK